MDKKRIILIEDEENLAAMIKLQAELLDYKLNVEVDGINGLRSIERERPDLVLLDIMLPGQNGYDVCRKMKNHPELKYIPVIMLSGKSDELDIVLGIELGAEDYLVKPFSLKVLFAKIQALFRKKGKDQDRQNRSFVFGPFTMEVDRYILRKNERVIPLTLSEFGILRRLVVYRGKVLSRNQLLEDVHHDNSCVIDRNIDVHVAALRKKLGNEFPWIETVRGVGYRFASNDS